MGEVSIFQANNQFGRSGSIRLGNNIRPCFTVRLGKFFNNARPHADGVLTTNFDIKKSENISVTPTLGTQLFLYVGGESAWEITLQGILLQGCWGKHGFDNLIDWYNANNVKTIGKPMDLTLNKKVYKGYLHRFQIQSEYRYTNCFSFTATFVGVLKGKGGK